MNDIKRIAKNIGVSGFSQIIISLLGFVILIYIARYFGEAGFGKYSFAVSITALLAIFTNPGIDNLIIREISRNKKIANEYITNAIIIKIPLCFLAFFIIVLTINLMDYPQDIKLIVYLFGIYMMLSSFTYLFFSIFQAFEKMEYTAAVMIIEKIILTLLIIFFLTQGYGLVVLANIYIIAGFICLVLSFFIVYMKILPLVGSIYNTSSYNEYYTKSVMFRRAINSSLCKTLFIGSIPFVFNNFFGIIFFHIDTIMLSVLKDDIAVGVYNAAYTPLLAITGIISYVVASALYPVMSRQFLSSKNSLIKYTVLSSKYIAIIGLPIAVGCFLLADRFITLFYVDQFSDSIVVFQILALFIPLRLIGIITGTLLTSIDKQNMRTISVGLGALVNIILNIGLIYYLGFIGASIATVLSEIFLYLVFIYFIHRYYMKLELHRHFIKPLVASLIMGGFILLFIRMNLFSLVILAGLVYFIILLLINTFTREDRDIFRQIIGKGENNREY
jgi:O-antigen/teichoic acid export membrane protein